MTLAINDTRLTTGEQTELIRHEAVITRGMQTFLEVGSALLAIRDNRLYREQHGTFEDYIKQRWPEIGRRRAYQLIGAAEVTANVNHGSLPAPENERQARPLTPLPADQQREAWERAVERSEGGQPTGRVVKAVVREMRQAPVELGDYSTYDWWTEEARTGMAKRGYVFITLVPPRMIRFANTNAPLTDTGGYIQSTMDRSRIEALLAQPEPEPEPAWPNDVVQDLMWICNWPLKRSEDGRYYVCIPSGAGGWMYGGWFEPAELINHVQRGVGETLRDYVKQHCITLRKHGYVVDEKQVRWQRLMIGDSQYTLAVYTITHFSKLLGEYHQFQVDDLVEVWDRADRRINEKDEEIHKTRKKLAQVDAQRYELEQRLRQLEQNQQ